MRLLLIIFMFTLYHLDVFSQNKVRGSISFRNMPVSHVLINNTKNGDFAISDKKGDFEIEIVSGSKNILEVFHLAYKEKTIIISQDDKFLKLELERAAYMIDSNTSAEPGKLFGKVIRSIPDNYLSKYHFMKYYYNGVAYKGSETSGEIVGEGFINLPDSFNGNQDFEVWWKTIKKSEFTIAYSPKLISVEHRAKFNNLNSVYFAFNSNILYSFDNGFAERFNFKVDSIRDYKNYKIIALSYSSDSNRKYIIKNGGTFYISTRDYSVLGSINYEEIPENSLLSDIAIDGKYLSFKETLYHKVSNKYYPYYIFSLTKNDGFNHKIKKDNKTVSQYMRHDIYITDISYSTPKRKVLRKYSPLNKYISIIKLE